MRGLVKLKVENMKDPARARIKSLNDDMKSWSSDPPEIGFNAGKN